jgi:hypothetical protein
MPSRITPLGVRYDVQPIPPRVEDTRYFRAGTLTIGVEHRLLTDDIVDANFDAGLRAESGIDANRPDDGLADEGWSVHVFDAATDLEYLRFDGFAGDPHYHYIVPGSHNVIVPYDGVALGDFQEFALSRLRTRHPDMLRESGAHELADTVDSGALEAALLDVERALAEAALQVGIHS